MARRLAGPAEPEAAAPELGPRGSGRAGTRAGPPFAPRRPRGRRARGALSGAALREGGGGGALPGRCRTAAPRPSARAGSSSSGRRPADSGGETGHPRADPRRRPRGTCGPRRAGGGPGARGRGSLPGPRSPGLGAASPAGVSL